MAPDSPSNTHESIVEELMYDAKRKGLIVHHGIIEKTICRSKKLPPPHITLNSICPDGGFICDSLEVLSAPESGESNPECIAQLRKRMGARKNQVSAAERELLKSEKQRELRGHKVDENDQQVYDEEEDDCITVSELCKLTSDEDNWKQKSSKFKHCSGVHRKRLRSVKVSNVSPYKIGSKYNASFVHKSNIITSMGSSLTRVTRNKSLKTSGTKCDEMLIPGKNSVTTFTNDYCSLETAKSAIVCDDSSDDDSTRSYPAGATVTNNMHSSRKTNSQQSIYCLRPMNSSIRRRDLSQYGTKSTMRSSPRLRVAKTSASSESVGSFPSLVDEPVITKNISPTIRMGTVSHLYHVPISSFNKTLRNGKIYDASEITTQDNMPEDSGTQQAIRFQQNRTAKGCASGLLTNSRQQSKTANTGTSDGVQVNARYNKHRSMQQLKSSTVDPFARRPQCSSIDIQCSIATSQSHLCQLSSNAIFNGNSDYSQIQLAGLSNLKCGQTEAAGSSPLLGSTVKNASSSNLTVSRRLRPRFQSKQSHLILYKDGSHGIFPKLSSGQHWRPSDACVGSVHVCSMSYYRAMEPNFKTVNFLKCVSNFDLCIGSSGEGLLAPHLEMAVSPAEQVDVPNLSTIAEETVDLGTSMACIPGTVGVDEGTGTQLFSPSLSSAELNSYINKPSGHLLETLQISSKDDMDVLCCKNNDESAVLGRSSANNIISRESESHVVDIQECPSITSARKSSSCDEFASSELTSQILQESVHSILVNGDQQESNSLPSMGLENDVGNHSSNCAQELNKHEKHGFKLSSYNNDSMTYDSISSNDSSREQLAKEKRSLGIVGVPFSRRLCPTKPSNTRVEVENCAIEEVLEDARSKKSYVCTPTSNLDEFSSSKTNSLEPTALGAHSSKIMHDEKIFVQSMLLKKTSLQLLYNDRNKEKVSSLRACNTSMDSANKTTDSFINFSQNGSSNQTNSFNNLHRKSLNLLGNESSDSDSDDGDSVCYRSAVSVHKRENNSISLQSLCMRPSLPERQFSSVKLIQSMLLDG